MVEVAHEQNNKHAFDVYHAFMTFICQFARLTTSYFHDWCSEQRHLN